MTAPQEAAQYRSLYELTGDIKDLNTMLVPRTALAQHREQQPVCHGCGIPAGDVHMSTCKSGKWPSRVSNGDTAAQAQQGEPVYQYQMADGSWIDQIKDSYDYNRKYAPNATVRVVYTAAPAPVEQRCTYCDGTGDVHSIDGEWRGTCHCAAAPAPQPVQDVKAA